MYLKSVNNTVSFFVYGNRAIFTDPITKPGGERHTYPVPTYDALRGILESVYWKPTIRWVISRVRVMTPIKKESMSMRLPKYTSNESDRSYHTYLTDVAYQVEAYFEWSNAPGTEKDQDVIKHLEIAKRFIARGGRYDVYLGSRECQAYVEPCVFGEGQGAYDYTPTVDFGLMYHGYTYPNMCGEPKLYARFWNASMENGIINFPTPEQCEIVRYIRYMPFTKTSQSYEEEIPSEISTPENIPGPSILDKTEPIQSGSDMRSWAGKLCETFDNLVALDQTNEDTPIGMLYPGHVLKQAQYELTLDGDGQLVPGSIRQISAEEANTIIPCSMTSQFRTSKKDPHLLFDFLEYLAGDYSDYIQDSGFSHKLYMDQLKKWCSSEASHPFVEIIYSYLVKGTLMSDLESAGVLPFAKPKEGESLHSQWPKSAGSSLVRFKIEIDGLVPEIWENHSLWDSACQFNQLQIAGDAKDICYVTGEMAWPAPLHPYLRGTTKLISSNDKTDFTYRYGIRDLPQDYLQISYDASQKIHLALRWLLSNQSFYVGEQTYVIWSTHNAEIPKVLMPGPSLFDEEDTEPDITSKKYAEYVHSYALGFTQSLPQNDEVVLLCLATPSKGRTAITQYETMSSSKFFRNLNDWYESAVAKLPHNGSMVLRAPTPFEVADVVCGGSKSDLRVKIIRQVLDAMILNRPLSRNIPKLMVSSMLTQFVSGAVQKATFYPTDYIPLNITVGVVRKYLNDLMKSDSTSCEVLWGMALNRESTDRSYLLGRLLAYYYQAEKLSQYISKNGYHITNAESLMHQYYNRPAYVLKLLEQGMAPYRSKLQRVRFGRAHLSEMTSFLSDLSPEIICDKPLTESFILGYYAQFNDFKVTNRGEEKNEDTAE